MREGAYVGRSRSRWEDNIKVFSGDSIGSMHWIDQA